MHISKVQFRLLVISSLALVIFGAAIDILLPNTTTEKIIEYAAEIESMPEGWQLIVLGAFGSVALILAIASFIGLLLFKRWGRIMYIAGYIAMVPIYPLMGVWVYGGISQLFYDLSMIAAGAILVLMYFSSVAAYFDNEI